MRDIAVLRCGAPQVEWLAMATGACRSGSAGRPGEALIRFTQETLRTSRARIQSIWSGPGARPGELTGVHGSGCEGDLAAVTYCDLAGLRAILSLAGAASGGHPGAGLLVLGILGWDATPGLVIDDEFTAPPDCGYRTG